MRAKIHVKSILAKLSKREQEALIDYIKEETQQYREAISLRLYLATVCALWDSGIIAYKASSKWDKFLLTLSDVIEGHADMAYGYKGIGEIDCMGKDMYAYLKGEGIQSRVLDQMYDQIMGGEQKDEQDDH